MTLSHRLEKYLHDNKVPDDIDQYFPDGPDSMFCVFCGLEHDNIPFTHSEDSIEQNTFKCTECSNIIENHLTRGQIQIDFMAEKNRLQNLKDYSELFYLPTAKFDYLDGSARAGRCMFCDEKPIGVPWTLEIPCGESLHSYGGIVNVCDRCNDWLLDKNTTLNHHISYTDDCPECDSVYPLTNSEYNVRCTLHTLKKHACPTCFYQIHPNGCRLIREETCEVCSTEIINDLTQVVDNPVDSCTPKIYCNVCSLASHNPEQEVIIKHTIPNVYINISTDNKGYAIYKVDTRRRKANVILSVDNISKNHSPEDIAYRASRRAYELLKDGLLSQQNRQTKLLL